MLAKKIYTLEVSTMMPAFGPGSFATAAKEWQG